MLHQKIRWSVWTPELRMSHSGCKRYATSPKLQEGRHNAGPLRMTSRPCHSSMSPSTTRKSLPSRPFASMLL